MMHGTRGRLRQRADYTHKFNAGSGRHGWLRLTPAYSVKVVEETIERYGTPCRVLDPFCGTGTTALSAVNRGHDAATVDVNPFLTWLARAKTARYSADSLAEAERAAADALDLVRREDVVPAAEPRIHRIERWWPEDSRRFLCRLKAAILRTADKSGPVSDLLHAAFCRTLIKLSNAAFNHQSMSFRAGPQCRLDLGAEGGSTFLDDLRFVLKGAAENPPAAALAVQGDARDLPSYLDARFDLVVTSPPYANRMSYIRELRPYMYWLGYLKDGRDAGELDWLAIGGTWGVATSRLGGWSPSGDCWLPDGLAAVVANIACRGNANGGLLGNYVSKYCEDMSRHFGGLRQVLHPGARIHYIVGNSTFYGVLVPTAQIYAAMLREYGFEEVRVRAIRKRNSKKELIEFDVSATWPKH